MAGGRNRKSVEAIQGHISNAEKEHRKEQEFLLKGDCEKLTPPTWLSKDAKKEFKRVASHLITLELISITDLAVVAIYADAYSHFQAATEEINKNGIVVSKIDGDDRVSPYVVAQQKYTEIIMKCSTKLGLFVSDRLKLIVPKAEKVVDEFDEFD